MGRLIVGLLRSAVRASSYASSGIATPERWVEDWVAGGEATAAGLYVSEETALHYSPFFAGVRVIAEDVGSLPLPVYERLERGKRRAREHPLYRVLHDQANDLMSAVAFRSTLQGHALTWPAGYAYIVRDGAGEVRELWPLRPDRIYPDPLPGRTGTGSLAVTYRYLDPVNGITARLRPDEVLTVAGLGFDGIRGYSIIGLARQSIALGLATERYGAAFFGNGSRPSGVLKHPKTLSDPGRTRLKTDWENLHRGLDRAQRVAILEEGLEWQSIGIPPEDAQFLETRRFGVTEMARWLRLPPHKIADLERATFTNIEHQGLDYVTSALRIWLVRWEQSIAQRLFTAGERDRFFAEHLLDALLRGDLKTRYEAYAVGRNWGWLCADDIAEMENRNPLPDGRGSVYLVPLNMVPAPLPENADQAATQQQAAAQLARQLRGRGVAARRRIAETYAPLIAEADRRVAKLERAEVASLVRRYLEPRAGGRTATEFLAALRVLYEGLVADRSTKALLPVLTQLALEIAADAAADVGHDGELSLDRWIGRYVDSHVGYRIGSAIGQLRKDVDAAAGDTAAAAAAVTERLDRWVEKRPERTAAWESTQVANAAAREAWIAAGVRRLRWVTSGGNCPFCTHMDGATTPIQTPFVAADGAVTGPEETLDVARNTFHPPLHPGCDCHVVPE